MGPKYTFLIVFNDNTPPRNVEAFSVEDARSQVDSTDRPWILSITPV